MFLSFCILDDFFRFSKKSGFGVFFVQQNMVETMLPDGLETLVERFIANFVIFLDVSEFCVFGDFFRFSKKWGFWVFLVHPPMASVLLSASVERCFVSRMRDFYRGTADHKLVQHCGL